MIIDGTPGENIKFLGNNISRKLLYSVMIKYDDEEPSFLEKLIEGVIFGGVLNWEKRNNLDRAKPYFIQAYNRIESGNMSKEEHRYLLNTDFREVTKDYLKGKINFK